jgi:hypothetical protein
MHRHTGNMKFTRVEGVAQATTLGVGADGLFYFDSYTYRSILTVVSFDVTHYQ